MAKTSKPLAPAAPTPPYLKHVHLRNVPPLRDVQADFKPGLNIIIGKNGSGKTNFMRLVSELADLDSEKYRGADSKLIVFQKKEFAVSFREQSIVPVDKNLSKRLAKQLPLIMSFTDEDKAIRDSILSEVIASQGVIDGYDIVAAWHGIPSYRLPIIDESIEIILSDSGQVAFASTAVTYWEVESRLVQAFLSSIRMMFYTDLGDFLEEKPKFETVRRWLGQSVDIHLDRLNTYLPVYSPLQAVRRSNQFQVYSNSSSDEIIIKGLVLEYQIAGDWLPFSALSDGTKRVFYLITELLTEFAFPSNEQGILELVDYDKIILLEEPELGIHPDQLQLLLQLIREVSQKHQVILTTHSPQTLDMLTAQELDRISICEFVPGKGTQLRKLSPAKRKKAKAYLADEGFLSEFWRFSNLEDPD